MKAFNLIVKIVVALTAIAGAVYVVATYGDKIVAWAKKMLGQCGCCCCGCEEAAEEAVEEAAEEVVEAAEAAEEAVEEIAEAAETAEADVVATEADFQ